MEKEFQIFGSKSSTDLDCMVFVDHIPENPYNATELCKFYNNKIQELTGTLKEVNSNLAIIDDEKIIAIYKGIVCECNNSLYLTYEHHEQFFPNKIKILLERDVTLKILRTLRVLLSFLSRSRYRKEIKKALSSDSDEKIRVLSLIDFSTIERDELKKQVLWTDFIKTMSFQLGQTIALMDGHELYSKESITDMYPLLGKYLKRDENASLDILETYKTIFLEKLSTFDLKIKIEY